MKIKDKDIKTVVPPLRFPEFRDAEGWEETRLGNIGAPSMCKRILKEQTTNIKDNNIPFYKIGTFGFEADAYIPTYLYNEYKSKYSYPKKGDILISASGTIGRLVVYNGEPAYFQDSNLVWINNNETTVLNYFLYYIYQNLKWQTSDGGIICRLYNTDLNSIKIKFPKERKEQKKVADCLGSLDDLISAVTDKIEALKEYKKGLMQQLFPAEGKTTPALRFPEFQNAGEWKDTILGEEVHYENGKAHENDIDEAGQYIVVNSKFISTDGEVVKYTNNPCCLAEEGDILMVLSDVPNGRAIAKCFIVDCNDRYTVNQRICKLKYKQAVGLLLYYIINRNPFLLAFDDGIKQTNLKKDDVLNCQFRLPEDPKEQQQIADCLSSVDELISAKNSKLDQLKAHKKGLMQQLFPTITQ